MSTLFTAVYDQSSADQTASLYRYCTSFEISTSWEKLLPIVEDAEREYLKPAFGDTFYQALVTAVTDPAPTPAMIAFMPLARRASAWFSFYQALHDLSVQVGAMGPGEPVDGEGRFPFARKWVTEAARLQAWRNAHQRLEEAMLFLENNADNYPDWKNSDAYTYRKELFIPSATILDEYLPCNRCARLVYQRLRQLIEKAEVRYLRPVMGETFFQEIKSYVASTDSMDADHLELLGYIRRALVEWVRKAALVHARLSLNEIGLIEPDNDDTARSRPAGDTAVNGLWNMSHRDGLYFLQELKNYLDRNTATWTTYADTKTPAGEPSQLDSDERPSSIINFL